jgi:hypothetical protein
MRGVSTDRNRQRTGILLLTIGALMLIGCASRDRGVSSAYVDPLSNAGVVDCLVPGQIRRLGSQMTYVGPGRTIRTSASDCEIRGGSVRTSSAASVPKE